MDIEKIGENILGAAFAIHSRFGSGLLERAYRIFLASELRRLGHCVEEEMSGSIQFNGISCENMFRVDLPVDDVVAVELKSVSRKNRFSPDSVSPIWVCRARD